MWDHLGPYETIRGHKGPYQTLQDHKGYSPPKKNSIFKDIIQIKVDHPPSHPIFDKFIFDKVLLMLTSLPPLEILTKIANFRH